MVTAADTSLLEVRGVSKSFDVVVQALDDVTITIRPNEIVGVVGENGAGKSTLMKILTGIHAPDKGELYYLGEQIPFPQNPKDAATRGISTVYQEKGVIPLLKVYQFLLLGHEEKYTRFARLQTDRMRQDACAILQELHVACDVDSYMQDLPLSSQKLVEIVRSILSVRLGQGDEHTTSIIILDEPTAPLTIEERRELFRDILALKKKASFVFVSHIIPEIMEFTDRVYVLRDGKLVAHYDLSKEKVTEEGLFKAIVGKESTQYIREPKSVQVENEPVVLSAANLTRQGCYYDISFDLHRGECVGIFGPAGSGKSEIIKTIAGLLEFQQGRLILQGQEVRAGEPPHSRLQKGVGYFSGETGKELFLNWPIAKNISLVNIDKVVSGFLKVINFNAEKKMAESVMHKLRIKAPSVNTACYSLSGGNKQKVSVGKWVEKSPALLLLEDPTIGIDVGARTDIYETVLDMKKNGISMILVSDDPKEYTVLCDRILYVKEGRVQRALSAEEFSEVTNA